MKNYEIKTATAEYTGGGIYIYYGQLENDLYFRTCDDWESISICNEDTSDDEAEYSDFYEAHQVGELFNDDYNIFWNEMLRWIISNSENGNYWIDDLKRRLIPEKHQESNEIHDRIVKLEQEILRLKRAESLQEFKEHMSNTFDAYMGDGCTNESVDTFYRMNFIITFNGKTIEINNGADAFQDIEYIVQREIDDLTE